MKHRIIPFSLFLLTIISISVFIFFRAFNFDQVSGYTVEILAGFLGAIITMIITTILLNAQTSSEVRRDKSIGVFQAKIDVYMAFLRDINKMINDGVIDDEEIIRLKHWALKLSLFAGEKVYFNLVDFIQEVLILRKFTFEDLTPEDRELWYHIMAEKYGEEVTRENIQNYFVTIGKIICSLREDLGEFEILLDSSKIKDYVDELIYKA